MKPPTSTIRPRAFTLVEVLVCVVILATLLGILLPAVRTVNQNAQSTACQANLRQLYVAFEHYRAENRGRVWTESLGVGGEWLNLLDFGPGSEALFCPAAREVADGISVTPMLAAGEGADSLAWRGQEGTPAAGYSGSYGFNALVDSWTPINALDVLFGDSTRPSGSFMSPETWTNVAAGLDVTAEVGRIIASGGFGVARHRGRSQVVLANGSVGQLRLD